MNPRTWRLLFATLPVLLTACIAPPKPPDYAAANKGFIAPKKTPFVWGSASASYQYEDPAVTPGSPAYFRTDWDLMVDRHGAPQKGNAVYSWTEFHKDVVALKKIGITHYRFSIEWARVEPRPGQFNQAAIDGYARMARELKAAGIEPVVCLWHFTFPDWLTDPKHPARSNWLNPIIETHWRAYLCRVIPAVAPYTKYYAPQNEPNGQITTAYIAGLWPPALVGHFHDYNLAIASSANLFRIAAQMCRQYDKDALIMSVEAMPWWKHGPLDPTGAFYNFMQHTNFDHLDRIYDTCDILGINYYYTQSASPLSILSIGRSHGPHYTSMGWSIDPLGLLKQIRTVSARYHRPMMVTENGLSSRDTVGNHDDAKRIRYLKEHIAVTQQARAAGLDVRGYFVWSLVDNYEWHYGYTAHFGLTTMDPKTKERLLKPGANFYKATIKKDASN